MQNHIPLAVSSYVIIAIASIRTTNNRHNCGVVMHRSEGRTGGGSKDLRPESASMALPLFHDIQPTVSQQWANSPTLSIWLSSATAIRCKSREGHWLMCTGHWWHCSCQCGQTIRVGLRHWTAWGPRTPLVLFGFIGEAGLGHALSRHLLRFYPKKRRASFPK